MKKEPTFIAFSTQKGGAGKDNTNGVDGKLPLLCQRLRCRGG